MSKFKTIVLACLIVLLCAGAKCTKDNLPPDTKVVIDPSLKVRCPELPQVDPQSLSMGQLYLEYSKLQGQYIECAIRNDCLIEATGDTTKVTCPALDTLKEKNKNG